jgi:hypothetical protein
VCSEISVELVTSMLRIKNLIQVAVANRHPFEPNLVTVKVKETSFGEASQ